MFLNGKVIDLSKFIYKEDNMLSVCKIRTLIICCLTTVLFINGYSQDSLTVTGKVIDQSSTPVESAEIITESNNSTFTDSNGEYTVKVLKNNVPVDNTDIKPNNYGSYNIMIFNILGQKIYESKFTNNSADRFTWNGYNNSGEMVSSGIYFPILMINNKVVSKSKVTVLGNSVSNIRPFINYNNKSSGSLAKTPQMNIQYTVYFDIRGDNFSDLTDYPIIIDNQENDGVYTAEDIQVNLDPKNGMILIEGGTYTMGDVWGDGFNDETPTHEVTVSSFYMSKYEISHTEYVNFLNSRDVSRDGSYNGNELIDMDDSDCAIAHDDSSFYFAGSDYASDEQCPVIEVTWYGAVEYCNWLSELEGLTKAYTISNDSVECDWNANGYRLPTEAEWEYAARSGGRDDRKWSGTNSKSELGDYAWYYVNSGSVTRPVGTKQPNDLGLYDMSGNVWEWCWDWYDSEYYSDSPSENPKGPKSGSTIVTRALRGGLWYGSSIVCRTADRTYDGPTGSHYHYGFRLLRTQ